MTQYIGNEEENNIRTLLDKIANRTGLKCPEKETQFKDKGFYLDRLWSFSLFNEPIPLVAFEIEKSVPSNERIRKDIFNIVLSKAPKGYIIVPNERILKKEIENKQGWETWYRNHFRLDFIKYCTPFMPYCNIQVVDADKLLNTESLAASVIIKNEKEVDPNNWTGS